MAGKYLFSSLEPYKLTLVELTGIKLGHGSYASVVEVNYMGLKCAGKKIHEVLLEQGETNYIVRHFEEECRILSSLRHPNIVQFLGVHFNENKRVPMLVMEFLPMNLTSCIQKHGILPDEIGYSILYDVALGLYFLHNQSSPIVHRDLSANNILLTYNMDAKISDLGVARILNLTPLQASQLTQTPGTPAYMPPEVMVANPKYNSSIDEFSFGIMMIHIFSGQWPEPECPQIEMSESGEMIPVTEAERRKTFLKAIGDDHPLTNAIMSCIHNDPRKRMHAYDITQLMAEMVQEFPRDQLDLLEHISRAKETTQLKPHGEFDSEEDDDCPDDEYDSEEYGDATVQTISSPESAIRLQSQVQSQFPKQVIEELEQVSGRESRSKSATLSRSQYDVPEIIEDVYESLEDISNKQVEIISRAQSLERVTKPQVPPKPQIPLSGKKGNLVQSKAETSRSTSPRKQSLGRVSYDSPPAPAPPAPAPRARPPRPPTQLRDEAEQAVDSGDEIINQISSVYVEDIIYEIPVADDVLDDHKVNVCQAKLPSEMIDSYIETTVAKEKMNVLESKIQNTPVSQPVSDERHIYDIESHETDDVSSMVELESWYFGNIDSTLARTKCKKDGDFLVRYSIDKQRYIISCRFNDTCHHCIVQQLDSGEYCIGSTASKSLSMLINYLVTSGIPVDSSGTVLRHYLSNIDRWTMKCTDFESLKTIGSSYSHSGVVDEAMDKRTHKRVIARSYDGMSPESLNAFLLDIEVLKRCNQSNIVSLIGVCMEPSPGDTLNLVYIVMEHMPGGIFLHYVQNEKNRRQKTQLCRMCMDIAKGLDYMHTRLSRAHADVAAKNCLVGQGALPVVKIFNLGNSMNFSNSSELKPIPQSYSLAFKWTAPETYTYQRHMLSDVWSYGVLLWEAFSGGDTPYPGMTNRMIPSQVQEGYRMNPPRNCPREISSIMLKCWKVDPNRRPTFSTLIAKLQAIYSERMNNGII